MTKTTVFGMALAVGMLAQTMTGSAAYAQHRHGSHSDQHNGWQWVVPYHNDHHHGAYHYNDGHYYYTPPVVIRDAYSPPVTYSPQTVQFGGFSHVEDLASRLESELNRLCLDMHYNYPHNPGFREAYREAYQLLEGAKFIHGNEHKGDRDAIRKTVTDIDGLLHHVQGQVTEWSRNPRRQYASGDINTKLESAESLLHHLMYDVGVKPQHDEPQDEIAPPPDGNEGPPAPGLSAQPPLQRPALRVLPKRALPSPPGPPPANATTEPAFQDAITTEPPPEDATPEPAFQDVITTEPPPTIDDP